MKFIDYLLRDPVCFNGDTDKCDFDARPLIQESTVFDISEIASQMIDSETDLPEGGTQTLLTSVGREWMRVGPQTDTFDVGRYVGIIPPFENSFFEYQSGKRCGPAEAQEMDVAVHLESLSPELIATRYPDDGFNFVMYATVFYRHIVNGASLNSRETVAVIASDAQGQLLCLRVFACIPPTEDPSLPRNQPHQVPICVTLAALMLMNCKIVKRTLSPDVAKSRQQRRYEERHPSRVEPPLVRFHTLSLDTDRIERDGGSAGKGGWEQAWHRVRGFLRHYKSGKVVPVKPHSRGNPLKGVVMKDYAVTKPTGKVA